LRLSRHFAAVSAIKVRFGEGAETSARAAQKFSAEQPSARLRLAKHSGRYVQKGLRDLCLPRRSFTEGGR
jgi:hypothetical protein